MARKRSMLGVSTLVSACKGPTRDAHPRYMNWPDRDWSSSSEWNVQANALASCAEMPGSKNGRSLEPGVAEAAPAN